MGRALTPAEDHGSGVTSLGLSAPEGLATMGRNLEGRGQLRLLLGSLPGRGRHPLGRPRVGGHAAARRAPGGCGQRAVLPGCHRAASLASAGVERLCLSVFQGGQEGACDRPGQPDGLNGNLSLSGPGVNENQHITFIRENGFYKPFYFPLLH